MFKFHQSLNMYIQQVICQLGELTQFMKETFQETLRHLWKDDVDTESPVNQQRSKSVKSSSDNNVIFSLVSEHRWVVEYLKLIKLSGRSIFMALPKSIMEKKQLINFNDTHQTLCVMTFKQRNSRPLTLTPHTPASLIKIPF